MGYPHLADNPVHHVVRLVSALLATPLDAGTAHFDASNLEVTSIDVGNTAVNVIPAAARAQFNIRFNDLWTPDTLADEIRARLAKAAGAARYEVTFRPTNALAFLTKPGAFVETLSSAIEAETGRRPTLSTTGGTSDARFICRLRAGAGVRPRRPDHARRGRAHERFRFAQTFSDFRAGAGIVLLEVTIAAPQRRLRYIRNHFCRTGSWADFQRTFSTPIPAAPPRA